MIRETIESVAGRLGVPPSWLSALLALESGFNPRAVNPVPYNKRAADAGLEPPKYARGLIQFTDEAARDLGLSGSAELVERWPDFAGQMENAVLPWLQRAAPFRDEQDFMMAVFFPAYRKVSPDTPFPAYVTRVNPAVRPNLAEPLEAATPADYLALARKSLARYPAYPDEGIAAAAGAVLPLAALAAVLGLLYLGGAS